MRVGWHPTLFCLPVVCFPQAGGNIGSAGNGILFFLFFFVWCDCFVRLPPPAPWPTSCPPPATDASTYENPHVRLADKQQNAALVSPVFFETTAGHSLVGAFRPSASLTADRWRKIRVTPTCGCWRTDPPKCRVERTALILAQEVFTGRNPSVILAAGNEKVSMMRK